MKYILRTIALLLILVNGAKANHIAGGGIVWEQIGLDTFKISMTVYADCNGSSLNKDIIVATSTCGTQKLGQSISGGLDVTPVCNEQCTRCVSKGCSFQYGLKKYTLTSVLYTKDWRLKSCCWVDLSWWQCCRPGSITTGAGSENLFYAARLNICDTKNNSSPQWTVDPLMITRLGIDLQDNLGATSVNKDDSVVYSFGEAYINGSTKVVWNTGYSYDKPLYYLGFPKDNLTFPRGIHFDSSNGSFKVRPMKVETSIINVKAEIYRNGLYAGYIQREHLIIIIKAPENNAPVISGLNCNLSNSSIENIALCPGEKLAFTLCTTDIDTADTVQMSAKHDIANAQIKISNGKQRYGQLEFTWTPDTSDMRNEPYRVWVKANDNACPTNGTSQKLINIWVRKPTKFKTKIRKLSCGEMELTAKPLTSIGYKTAAWKINGVDLVFSDSIVYKFTKPGINYYSYKAYSDSSCAFYFQDSVFVSDTLLRIKPFNHNKIVCKGDSFELKAKIIGHKAMPTIQWQNGPTLNDSVVYLKQSTQKDSIYYRFTASDGFCSTSDSFLVTTRKSHISLANPNPICVGTEAKIDFQFTDSQFNIGDISKIEWRNNRNQLISFGNDINVKDSGYYTLQVTDTANCTYIDTAWLKVIVPHFNISADTVVCIGQNFVVTGKSQQKGYFNWYIGGKSINVPRTSYLNKYQFSYYPTQNEMIRTRFYYNDLGLNCTASDSFHLSLKSKKPFGITAQNGVCLGDSIAMESKLDSIQWNFNSKIFLGKRAVFYNTDTALINKFSEIHVRNTEKSSCPNDSVFQVFNYRKPLAKFEIDSLMVLYLTYKPKNLSVYETYYSYNWKIEGPENFNLSGFEPNFKFTELGIYEINFKITNLKANCFDEITKTIEVRNFVGLGDEQELQAEIYPNPAQELLTVHFQENINSTIKIITLSGIVLTEFESNSTKLEIPVYAYANGLYFIEIANKNMLKREMFQIIH